MVRNIKVAGKEFSLKLERSGENWTCQLGERAIPIRARLIRPNLLLLSVEDKTYEIHRDRFGNQSRVWIDNRAYPIDVSDPRSLNSYSRDATKNGASRILALMPGKVIRILVEDAQKVEPGQALLVVEAMKMQNEIKSPNKGVVRLVVSEGTRVNAGDVLALVE